MKPNQKFSIELSDDGKVGFQSVMEKPKPTTYYIANGQWSVTFSEKETATASRGNTVTLLVRHGKQELLYKLGISEDNGAITLWKQYGDPNALSIAVENRPLSR